MNHTSKFPTFSYPLTQLYVPYSSSQTPWDSLIPIAQASFDIIDTIPCRRAFHVSTNKAQKLDCVFKCFTFSQLHAMRQQETHLPQNEYTSFHVKMNCSAPILCIDIVNFTLWRIATRTSEQDISSRRTLHCSCNNEGISTTITYENMCYESEMWNSFCMFQNVRFYCMEIFRYDQIKLVKILYEIATDGL